jgi:hypothetical protein
VDRGWSFTDGCCASVGICKLPDQISEQGADHYDDSMKGSEKDERYVNEKHEAAMIMAL